MHDRANRADTIRQIGTVLATAYLRLRFSAPPQVDCAETKSESCDSRLTP
jgi:hypothetical protein